MSAATSSEICAAVRAALDRSQDDVIYVHDEAGQPIAALIPIDVWRSELSQPEPMPALPFDTYTHDHITPQDDEDEA